MTTTRNTSATIGDETISESGMEREHPLAEAGEEVGETAGHLAERATNVGFQQADHAREQAADGLHQLADSVRRVSTDMESEQPAIAGLTSTAAEQTERVASFLRETDARQLIHGVEDLARRQPLLFVGGAFLLGVAASRFIKAAGGGSSQRGGMATGSRYRETGEYGRGTTGYEAIGPGGSRIGATGDRFADAGDEGLRP